MFEDILAQEAVKAQLERLVVTNRLPHGMVFYGPPRTGKYRTALAFAKAINCRNERRSNCECASCKKIERNYHPDFHYVRPGEDGHIKVDQIRALSEGLQLCRNEGARKVVLIHQAHLMNNYAANALLKTLEEPSEDTTLILTTSNVTRLLPTIVSRCHAVRFSYLPDSAIIYLLQRDSQTVDPVGISMMAGSYSPERIRDEFVLLRHVWEGTAVDPPNKIEPEQLKAELVCVAHVVNHLLATGSYQYRKVYITRPNPEKLQKLHSITELAITYLEKGVRPLLVLHNYTHRMREVLG